tara:strand:+ start:23187 stop:23894 length:708 start_codon:yes stop_codon:yes gene_type:complete
MQKINLLKQKCKKLSILYVEDEEKVRVQTAKTLSIYFDKIILAENGKEALKKYKHQKIDIIFTDINMPVMDGLSMIELIRKIDINIPIIVFSAYDNTEYLLKTIEYGIDGYILKPFNFEQIQKIIEKVIKKLFNTSHQTHILKLISGFTWHIETQNLYKNEKQVVLTKNESSLFKLLSSTKNATFLNEEIESVLFNDNYSDNKRVRGLISRLHKKVGTHLIKSIYGQGYELNLDE